MCDYAATVNAVIEKENIEKIFLIGHSMGGYIAMAFAENHSEKLSALCLFHSHPFADSEETKQARASLINEIKTSGKEKLCKEHPPKVFAENNVENFKNEIKNMQNKALKMTEKAIISSISAMKGRKDRADILARCKVPFLYIIGVKDNFIPLSILDKIKMPKNHTTVVMENSGHMSMIEEVDEITNILSNFVHTKIAEY